MRRRNAEWDFMGRSFLVWSLADMALREPAAKPVYLPVMDQIIGETLRLEREQGIYCFLMPYAKAQPFVEQPARSLFLDSELALMLASRRAVEEKAEYRPLLAERVAAMIERMRRSKVLAAESYPNECWLFDHSVALAAIRLADYLDGSDHSGFCREWIARAKETLLHRETGLLVSSFTTDGKPMDGPEGSSIWLAAHCLRLVDEDFARDQYRRARKELGRVLCGFAWSREWPILWKGPMDVDSGAVIPGLDISAGGSGLAFVGASSFGDVDYLSKLHSTLDFSAFPQREGGRLKYCASNQVGDAVIPLCLRPRTDLGQGQGGQTMNGHIAGWLRTAFRAKLFSPLGFLLRVLLVAITFGICHAAGLREHTTFLSGTTTSVVATVDGSVVLGTFYVVAYHAFVLICPSLLLAAALLSLWLKWLKRHAHERDAAGLENR